VIRLLHSLALLTFAGTAAKGQEPTAVVTGVVRDALGAPIRDAVVVIDAESTTVLRTRAGVDGRFRIERVRAGQHALWVARIGFRPHRTTIDVPVPGLDVVITLETAPALLDTVSVRVARTGIHGIVTTRGISLLPHEPRPLRGAIVEVLDRPYRVTTDREGRFRIDAIEGGAYSLLVRIDRYQSRIVPAQVPETGGLDMDIVLDSTIGDWQRREDYQLRDISRRLREANNPSAFVSAVELVGPEGMTLKEALRFAPSTLSRGMLVKDDITCVYVDGQPRPGMTAGDILADDVHAVEVYGASSGVAPPVRWLLGTFCGTGARQGPGRQPPSDGVRTIRPAMDNFVRVLVVWMKRRR
jgi:hypothetical protein